jgi:DNA gyrase subunit A
MARKKKKAEVEIVDNTVITDTEMSEEMSASYLNYALAVIMSRALPDVRDGLKPVHRRVLYAMNQLKLYPSSGYKKSARIVGDVLGKMHPHGDSSVYEAMVRMAQDFKNGEPLVDGHGNYGSIDGDSPAHMRYTEAKLKPIALTMLEELSNDVVDFQNNFDDTEIEPTVLPSKLPMLLVNGANGVAVGMATMIPTHNVGEVVDSYIAYLDKENIEIEDLLEYLKGPDFPTGGIITNADEFNKAFYTTGEASLILRCNYFFEDADKGKTNIVIDEIPFQVNKQKLVEKIVDLIKDRDKDKDKIFDAVSDIRDESSRAGMRIVVELKKGYEPELVMKKLLSKTKLEESKSYKFLAVDEHKKPITYNLKTYFESVYNFQRDFYSRKYRKILNTALSEKEILDGYLKADEFIDTIIDVIRHTKASCRAEAVTIVKDVLMNGNVDYLEDSEVLKKHLKIAKSFNFTEKQADSIVRKDLISLMNFQTEEYKKQLEKLLVKIAECEKILGDEKELKKILKKELRAIKKEFAKDRKTKLNNSGRETYVETLLIEDVLYLIDDVDYVKVVDVPRNFNEEDYKDYRLARVSKNVDYIRVFTNKGRFLKLDIKAIGGLSKLKDRGKPLSVALELEKGEKVLLADTHGYIMDKDYILITKNNFIRYVEGNELDSKNKNIAYTNLQEGDEVVDIKLVDKDIEFDIDVTTKPKARMTIKFEKIKKTSKGAKGVVLREFLKAGKELKSFEIVNIREVSNIEEETFEEATMFVDENGNIKLDF